MNTSVSALRNELNSRNLMGFILPKTDEYQNEYSAAYAERLAWVSGFTGSAGLGVVGVDTAALFVDGRYGLQAKEQVDESVFIVAPLDDTTVASWVNANFRAGTRLGYDPALHTKSSLTVFQEASALSEIELVAVTTNPVDDCWYDRPERPTTNIVEHPLCYAGEASRDKCQRLSEWLKHKRIDSLLITMPDCVAWLLNVRARDIPHVPVALTRAILYQNGRIDWFVDSGRTDFSDSGESRTHVDIQPEATFTEKLRAIAHSGDKVMVDESAVSLKIRDLLVNEGAELVDGNPAFAEKARKNARELEGARNAHKRDGIALVNFLVWFDKTAVAGQLSELDIVEKLLSLRQQQKHFQEVSFDTISGSGSNGAIVHYRVNETSNKCLDDNSLFLVDSGAQYLDGTTDVTRTLAVGCPTDEQREHFTRVLKGHIAIASCRFPKGTSGHQIDCLARQALWQVGLDYGHGTGHGVGSYLGVHEGPQRIAPWPNSVPLETGMIVSNEPGYYKEGEYGIRIENLIVVTDSETYPGFLEFETLTLAPIDQRLVNIDLLSREEIAWVDHYHQQVFATLEASVSKDVHSWLKQITQPLKDGKSKPLR